MPVSEYYSGSGDKVMANMVKQYGPEKGKQVFYAKANKIGAKPAQTGDMAAPDPFSGDPNPNEEDNPRNPWNDNIPPRQPNRPIQMPGDGPPPGMQGSVPPMLASASPMGMPPSSGVPPEPGPPVPPVLNTVPVSGMPPSPVTPSIAPPPRSAALPTPARIPIGQGPVQKQATEAALELAAKMGVKVPLWKQALGRALSNMPGIIGAPGRALGPMLTQVPGLAQAEQKALILGKAADEERKQQYNEASIQEKQASVGANTAYRDAQIALRQQALKPAQTMQQIYTTAAALKDADGNPVYTPDELKVLASGSKLLQQKADKYINVPQGGTLIDATTGKTVFTAPDKPEPRNPNDTLSKEVATRIVANGGDPTKPADVQKAIDQVYAEKVKLTSAEATARTAASRTPFDIQPGSKEERFAQSLASGVLRLQDLRTMYAYSRDANVKAAIVDRAMTIPGSRFNPSQFATAFNYANNVGVQKQLASIVNVESALPDLLKVSDDATRAGAPILNKFILPGGYMIGGQKYSDLAVARKLFADELSGALGFGSASDLKTQLGLDIVDEKLDPANFRSAMQKVQGFLKRKKDSMLQEMGVYGPMSPAATPQGGTPPSTAPGNRKVWNPVSNRFE